MTNDTQKARAPRAFVQPLDVVQIPEARLKIQTVCAVTGLSASNIRRRVAARSFPQPVKDGEHCVRWIAGDVMSWLRTTL